MGGGHRDAPRRGHIQNGRRFGRDIFTVCNVSPTSPPAALSHDSAYQPHSATGQRASPVRLRVSGCLADSFRHNRPLQTSRAAVSTGTTVETRLRLELVFTRLQLGSLTQKASHPGFLIWRPALIWFWCKCALMFRCSLKPKLCSAGRVLEGPPETKPNPPPPTASAPNLPVQLRVTNQPLRGSPKLA